MQELSPTKHQNEADGLLTVGRTFAGAFIILYVPCRFCFAWPEFWKVYFHIFLLHTIRSISAARKRQIQCLHAQIALVLQPAL